MITAGELARQLEADLHGDADRTIDAIRPPELATATDLAYIADDRKLPERIAAGIILVAQERDLADCATGDATLLRHPHVQLAFAKVIAIVHPAHAPPNEGIAASAVIDPTATIGADCVIGANAVIGPQVEIGDRVRIDPGVVIVSHATIGAGSHLHANVTIYPESRLGSEVRVLAGAVIGADGFGFVPTKSGPLRVPHVGGVQIGDQVEIGANATIDRGVLGDTVIGTAVKLDNLVHIAHNCEIGAGSVFAAQVGIAGSTKIGVGVQFGGQSGAGGHIEIGDGCRVGARAGVIQSFPAGLELLGFPATEASKARRAYVTIAQLPEYRRRIEELLRLLEGELPKSDEASSE